MSEWIKLYKTQFEELVYQGDWTAVNKFFLEHVQRPVCKVDDMKYMIDMGADPRAENDRAIVYAADSGRGAMIKHYFY